MDAVHITEADGHVWLESPYNPDLPARARRIGGRWDPERRMWRFDPRDADKVRNLAHDIYGWTDDTDDTVTVRIKAKDYMQQYGPWDRVTFLGRDIVRKYDRDRPERLAEGVIVVSGGWDTSGGSRNRPALVDTDAPTILEIRDVPRAALDRLDPGTYELVDGDGKLAALRAERDRLAARLADIDRRIAELEGAQ